MDREKKKYPDDDGRTIADMSGIERQPLLLPRFRKRGHNLSDTGGSRQTKDQLSKEERRSYLFGALGAALLIAAVFVVVFAVAIIIMLQFWR